jgi:hypothetical protein
MVSDWQNWWKPGKQIYKRILLENLRFFGVELDQLEFPKQIFIVFDWAALKIKRFCSKKFIREARDELADIQFPKGDPRPDHKIDLLLQVPYH